MFGRVLNTPLNCVHEIWISEHCVNYQYFFKTSVHPVCLLTLSFSPISISNSFIWSDHCVKNVQIRSYIWSVFSCIQFKYRKIRIRNNSVFGHFSRSGSLRFTLVDLWGLHIVENCCWWWWQCQVRAYWSAQVRKTSEARAHFALWKEKNIRSRNFCRIG